MKKADLVLKTAEICNMKKKDAEPIVNAVFEAIMDTVASGEKVHISGFGIFDVRERKAREGVNPRSKEPMVIEASYLPTFRAGKSFKEKVAVADIKTEETE